MCCQTKRESIIGIIDVYLGAMHKLNGMNSYYPANRSRIKKLARTASRFVGGIKTINKGGKRVEMKILRA